METVRQNYKLFSLADQSIPRPPVHFLLNFKQFSGKISNPVSGLASTTCEILDPQLAMHG